MGSLSELWNLFIHPKKFFQDVDHEKKYAPLMFYYVLVYAIVAISSFVISLAVMGFIFGDLNLSFISFFLFVGFLSLIVKIGYSFGAPFVQAAFTHLGVMAFGGKGGYFNTYKSSVYTLVLAAIYFAVLNILLFMIVLLGGLFGGAYILAVLAAVVHILYVYSTGVGHCHNMSRWRAFASIMFVPLIFLALVVILVALVFLIL